MPAPGGIKAGRAFIIIGAVDKTGMIMRRISAKMKGFATRMSSLGQQMLSKSLALLVPTGIAVGRFAAFDDAMKKVEARSAGTAKQLEDLRMQAKELGRTTSFTAVQVGELQAKLAQKGFVRADIRQMTDDVLALARAAGAGGEEDPVQAADLISGTIRAFSMEAGDAGRIADIFATAVNNSNFSLEGMLDGMAKIGPLASDMNMSLEETVATLASMTNLNVEATVAGTALQSFLARMSKAEFTGKFNKGLEKMGKATINFRDAEGNLRDPLTLLKEIGETTKDLGTGARADLLSILFGVRQFGKAAAGMRGSTDAFELLDMLINKAEGSAKKTAQTMDSGLGGSFRKLKSALEGVMIAIGESLEEPLMKVGDQVIEFLGGITEWIGKNEGLIIAIVGTAAAFAIAGTALMLFAGVLKLVAIGIGILVAAIAIVKGALLLIGIVIGALLSPITMVGIALFTLSSDVRRIVTGMANFLSQKFGEIAGTISDTFGGIIDALAVGDLQAAWEIFGQGITTTWLQVVDTIAEAWEGFVSFFVKVWEGARMIATQTWFAIEKKISSGILRLAEDAGILGEYLDAIIGIDVSKTKAKAERLEEQRQQVMRNRLRAFEEEMNTLLQRQRLAVPGSQEFMQVQNAMAELQPRIDDLKTSLSRTDQQYQSAADMVEQQFDKKIAQAGADATKNLESWNDRVRASNKARDEEIRNEKANLRRMLDEIRARRDSADAARALEEMDRQREASEEAFAKTMEEGAAGRGPIAPDIPGVQVTPQKALEEGTVAAAQKIAEIQFREGIPQKQLAEAVKTNDLLADQNDLIRDQEQVVGV